jgi:hypothetical protein
MPRPEPILGYRSKTAAVLAMRSQGLSTEIIAERLMIASKDVAALEHSAARWKRAVRGIRPAEANGRTVLFPVDILNALGPHAAKRGISPNELARRIVETAVEENMIDAVMDDEEESQSCP